MSALTIDDFVYCEGTAEQPHPGAWFFNPCPIPPQYLESRQGRCPICVMLEHVIPVTKTCINVGGCVHEDYIRKGKLTVKKS